MAKRLTGNAEDFGADTRGWMVGDFMPPGLANSQVVSVKWGRHPAGDKREAWATDEQMTLTILISGEQRVFFPDGEIMLSKPGDFVLWEPGGQHRWETLSEAVLVTVRWSEVAKQE